MEWFGMSTSYYLVLLACIFFCPIWFYARNSEKETVSMDLDVELPEEIIQGTVPYDPSSGYHVKVVIVGPAHAGKCTFLQHLYDNLEYDEQECFEHITLNLKWAVITPNSCKENNIPIYLHVYSTNWVYAYDNDLWLMFRSVGVVLFVADSSKERLYSNQSELDRTQTLFALQGKTLPTNRKAGSHYRSRRKDEKNNSYVHTYRFTNEGALLEIPMIVAANKQDEKKISTNEELREVLELQNDVPIINTIFLQKEGIHETFELIKREASKHVHEAVRDGRIREMEFYTSAKKTSNT